MSFYTFINLFFVFIRGFVMQSPLFLFNDFVSKNKDKIIFQGKGLRKRLLLKKENMVKLTFHSYDF